MSRVIDIAIGMSDGLIVPLALSAGMYAAGVPEESVFKYGICIVGAGTVIMTLGGYLAGRSGFEQPVVVSDNKDFPADPVLAEEMATRLFLSKLDLDTDIQEKAIEDWQKEKAEWAGLMEEEREMMQRKEKRKRPSEYAVNIGASYLLGGLVPLLPYLLFTKPEVLSISISITLTLIFILGVMKSKSLLLPWWRESSRLTLLAILATSGAFATGYFFF